VAIADDLQRRWYARGAAPPWWTLPVAAVFGGVSCLRRGLYRHGWLKSTHLPVPVIVAGNISVGGAGKTPLTIALAEGLRARGFKPGVVSRGYSGSARVPMLLDAQPDPAIVGDEPALIRSRTGAPVAIGADRVAASRLLLEAGVDVIIADDGLQHYALGRDVEICVVDGERRFGNQQLLPAGPLREPLVRLRTVDFIVCNGGEPQSGEIPMRLALRDAVSLVDPTRKRSLADFAGTRVHAVAGIGNPPRFFKSLRGRGIGIIEHPFPDHHRYTATELDFGDGAPVLMTEKDAVKCRALAAGHWWSVPVSAVLPDSLFDDVASKLRRKDQVVF
jgi:tetraacyldisaccharide 4'-kinase